MGPAGIGQGMFDHNTPGWQTFERCHFDIGVREHGHYTGSGHPQNVGKDDGNQRQHGQGYDVHPFPKADVRGHGGHTGKPAELDGNHRNQHIGNEKFRHGNRGQTEKVDDPVVCTIGSDRRDHPKN